MGGFDLRPWSQNSVPLAGNATPAGQAQTMSSRHLGDLRTNPPAFALHVKAARNRSYCGDAELYSTACQYGLSCPKERNGPSRKSWRLEPKVPAEARSFVVMP